ncbi:MAG: hypothetical protein ABFE13_11955 [Phycisphaerales bacterium]
MATDTLQSLLTEAQKAGELPETARWLRWLTRIEASCLTIDCPDCEFGPSCDEGDHEPHAIELLTAVVERERMLRRKYVDYMAGDVHTAHKTRSYDEWLADLKARSQEVGR